VSLAASQSSLVGRTVAITGASSGLGLGLAVGFANRGYEVFGTAISEDAVAEADSAVADLDITLTVCDISDPAQVTGWAGQVTAVLGGRGLDVLVNNAGVLTPGPMEVIALEAIRREFEVNVFGSLATIAAFLPLLRHSRGRIVQIGSASGFFALPFSGPSSASKAAMESFADVFRIELRPFGVEFVIVEPGNMATGGPAKTAAQMERVAETMTDDQRALYGPQFAQFMTAFNAMQGGGISVTDAAAAVIALAEEIPAQTRATVGDSDTLAALVKEKSDGELDAYKLAMFGLNT
jgi:NAD(P)-dependent dehydrogenase (short-subunit alcohol dehydrogenase family)